MYNNLIRTSLRESIIIEGAMQEIGFATPSLKLMSLKRLFDITGSLFILIAFSWLYCIIAIAVKASSKGSVIYSQERIGLNGIPFVIYKFRTMYMDAEKNGPALSNDHDVRVTPTGRFLRKTHLDELPQFYNVLIGDMSIIGIRPERQCYIDTIVKKAPHYKNVFKNKPGITSWGQVRYGYAENIEEMIDRLYFDVFYLKNRSLQMDVKILLCTIILILSGRTNNSTL